MIVDLSELDKKDFDDVVKLNVSGGDVVIVTLPEEISRQPINQYAKTARSVSDQFEVALNGKGVQVVVIPYGMKVELLRVAPANDVTE